MEIEFGGDRKITLILRQLRGERCRLVPQELCPPLAWGTKRLDRWGSQSGVYNKKKRTLHSSISCSVSKHPYLGSGDPVIGFYSLIIQ